MAKQEKQTMPDFGSVPKESAGKTSKSAEIDMRRFFDLSLDLLCVADLDSGYFKRLNSVWEDRLGWHLDELTSKPFIEFVHVDDRERTLTEVQRLIEGAKTVMFENRWRHIDGSYRWLQWNANLAGSEQFVYATARDVTRQKQLEMEVLEVADSERERLGYELHDGLCQNLAGVAAMSSRLSRDLSANTESGFSAKAAEITELLKDCINEARDLARGLGPIGVHDLELDELLENLAENLRRQFEVSFVLNCDGLLIGLDDSAKAHLIRIVQEACHNSVVHGRADEIVVDLVAKKGNFILSIRDDGIGIPESKGDARGLGTHTMAYRATSVGGSLEIRRRNGRGTTVICSMPLPRSSRMD